mmetsp:Transcript_6790/g.15385  ORF Transcript_6790/g.15385 Transcript_6790/m.15385 type:complete len:548 (-) Transcript_6790:44-1687(-)
MKYQVTRRFLVFNDVGYRQSAQRLCMASMQHVVAQLTNQIDRPHRRRLHNSSLAPMHSDLSFINKKTQHFPLRSGIMSRSILNLPQTSNSIQTRSIASWAPDFMQDFSVWGGTGVVLKSLHTMGLPYWTSFSAMNFMLRASLLPLVIYGAQTASRYAKVAPEIQFIITLFQNDLKKMRAEGKSLLEQRYLFLQNLETVRSIYKLHSINPLTVFLSPFLQIPFFYYVATDLRKIVNGSNPELAQELTESSLLWIPDLTDPDPWFGLPIAAGAMLYFNVEVAIGKKSLSGPAASQSDFAGKLKDLFQTLAVFMPCFTAQSPAGLQIYLVSSFTWTLFQSAALRNDTIRGWVNLPAMGNPPTEPKFAKEFMEFKKLEQKAKEIRGDGPVLGRNVLAVGFETSFPGTDHPSTIRGSDIPPQEVDAENEINSAELSKVPKISMEQASAVWGGQYIHGISAPMHEIEARVMNELRDERVKELASQNLTSEQGKFMTQGSEDDMEAANLGVKIATTQSPISQSSATLDHSTFKKRRGSSVAKKRGGQTRNRRKR